MDHPAPCSYIVQRFLDLCSINISLYVVCGDLRGIHQSTGSRIIKRISHQIATEARNYIKFPQTENEWDVVKQKFYDVAGMPGVGAYNPGGPNGEVLRNRKGWFSLNVQIIT